jgi:hypothetical protein
VSTLPLFDSRHRDDAAYKRAEETTYAFLDRVSQPELAAPREFLTAWFERWRADDREELRARLMSKDPAGFDGAFWELYLHEVLTRLGFSIRRDPEIPGFSTRPDFLMQRDGAAFYLEATVVGMPASVVARRRREQHVIGLINEAYHPDFSLRLRGLAVGPQQPPRRMIVESVEKWLHTLDWQAERTSINDRGRDPVHIEVRGTHLFVSPWPRAPEVRGDRRFPTVVTHSPEGGVLNEPPMILDDLRDKAGKFGRLDKPYVIAVLCQRDFASDHDVEQALYGPEVVRMAVGPDGPVGDAQLDRKPRGFWQHDDRKQATRVSAVLSAIHLNPWSVSQVPLRLWRNPWAALPLEVRLPWATTDGDLATNQLVQRPATTEPRALLGLAGG